MSSAAVSGMLPAWAREVTDLYESGASAQFILHGNVSDSVLIPGAENSLRIGSLDAYIREVLLARFDVVLSYDLGNGIRVERAKCLQRQPCGVPPGWRCNRDAQCCEA